ncbi:MAG: hypothetical protein DWQ10_12710 [Calditrichaeota bacterium]|nr:MAG: hypothetical protein DWQ10_12710 [Calditrichota bacterium]
MIEFVYCLIVHGMPHGRTIKMGCAQVTILVVHGMPHGRTMKPGICPNLNHHAEKSFCTIVNDGHLGELISL